MDTTEHSPEEWQATACCLCGTNCGIQVKTEDGHFTKIKGDKAHPTSQGYTCQKATRLDFYQNHKQRLTKPLRRRPDGSFEEVSWDTAISEVAAKLVEIRDTHGGHAIAQFGGGGQGNHLNGGYSGALRVACDTRYLYSSLAQEKTGAFWVNGRMFGKQGNIPVPDHHGSDFMLCIGWNPWQSHGMPRARKVIQDITKDENFTLAVIDPRRSETAEKADYHLPVSPGGDAHLMLAMLAIIVNENLEDAAFLRERCTGWDELKAQLATIPIDEYIEHSGVDADLVFELTRKFAAAKAATVHTDLGLEQTLHSTLNMYLSKLLWVVTGNFGREGTVRLHQPLVSLVGSSKDPESGGRTGRVTGQREIGKMYPPNMLPLEIDNDHTDRLRALFVDSSNPVMTAADGQATRAAFEKLELLVSIDVALTETARMAHYVLPASSQYEKWETTFFSPTTMHLRKPLFEPAGDTLPEAEIYRRLVVAMGAFPESLPELEQAARDHVADPTQNMFGMAIMTTLHERPELRNYAAMVLYTTLGKVLPEGAASAAILWGPCQQFALSNPDALIGAGIKDAGGGLGEALFQRILNDRSGVQFSVTPPESSWDLISTPDKKIQLVVPEMIEEMEELAIAEHDPEYPYILQAGERRDYNANQINRDADWRKKDREGSLKVHPVDAASIGLEDGGTATIRSKRASLNARVRVTDEVPTGFVTLPHGYGMIDVVHEDGSTEAVGPDINMLSSSTHCDRIAATPFHKYIQVAVTPALVPATP